MAIRNFIQENKPLLTIHGHIHESVKMSNQFITNLSDDNENNNYISASISVGNDFKSSYLSVIEIDTNDIFNAKRYNL